MTYFLKSICMDFSCICTLEGWDLSSSCQHVVLKGCSRVTSHMGRFKGSGDTEG